MWFIFGFITLISFSIYSGYKRLNAAWKGNELTVKDISYQYMVLQYRGNIMGLLVGIAGPPGYDYALKKETSIDRFFKFIGLSVEYQIGNKEFDDLVYVVSDSGDVHKQISSNNTMVDTAIQLFKSGDKFNCKVKEIRNNSGRLWVRFKTAKGFEKNKIFDLSSEVAILLKQMAREFEHIPASSASKWKDPFVIKAASILAISTGMVINGLSHLMRLAWTTTPFTVDSSQLFFDSMYWAAGIIITLLIASVIFLGRSARAHLVMLELIFAGTFGAASTVFAELRDINIELDESVAAIYEAKALDKRISSSRRSGTRYYLYLNDWNNEKASKKVKVSNDLYHSVSIGDDLVIKQKTGHLKYRWVKSLEKKR